MKANSPFVIGLALVLATFSQGAHAQAEDRKGGNALALGRVALSHYEARDFKVALAEFDEAEAVAHSPVFQLYAARCARELGQWASAQERLRTLVGSGERANDPEPWRDARRAAAKELSELQEAMPRLQIVVRGRVDESLKLMLDGKEALTFALSSEHAVDPGEHHIEVRRGSQILAVQVVQATRGTRQQVVMQWAEPAASDGSTSNEATGGPAVPTPRTRAPSTAAPAAPALAARERAPEPSGTNTPAVVALGLGTAGVVVGAVAGFLAWREHETLSDECNGNSCDPDLSPHATRGRTYLGVATAGFVAGGAGLATGGVLLYLEPPRTSDPATPVTVGSLRVGSVTVGYQGRF